MSWNWAAWQYNRNAYLIPVIYVSVAYALVWSFGLGGVPSEETIADWAQTLGLQGRNQSVVLAMMIVLLGLIGFIKYLGAILGEELGWRGFLIWELRKVMPFGVVSLVSGLIWATWHWPLVVYVIAHHGGLRPS
ncbi:CPBP family intramembrane glutamic endopeptidase [Paremcibacter congregatus]|uniref:CAAX prenyl protease 2/Lysostaphin resistance protein A-like domain-containing protein n=1 Tax=Paremcibacter congregatus TaxID=2043170 RepID=A0A2G4YQX0_9PROT|nr:CPBP family intramembrane glutamic endopeptidase [Paremcibacter congregatus]PHZ84721.1 hypothetical protein CRD36_10570 [Paremcibacter congregatus]